MDEDNNKLNQSKGMNIDQRDDRNILAYNDSDEDDIENAFSNLSDINPNSIINFNIKKNYEEDTFGDRKIKTILESKRNLYLNGNSQNQNTNRDRDNSEIGIKVEGSTTARDLSPRVVNFQKDILKKGSVIKAHTPREMYTPKS